jgi:hypothetical protein
MRKLLGALAVIGFGMFIYSEYKKAKAKAKKDTIIITQ